MRRIWESKDEKLERIREQRLLARKRRQAEANHRAEERVRRSPAEQLARLDQKFGPGQGAKKERARLEKQLAEAAKQNR